MNKKTKLGLYTALGLLTFFSPLGLAHKGVHVGHSKKYRMLGSKATYQNSKLQNNRFRKGLRNGQITKWEAKLYKKRSQQLQKVKKLAKRDGIINKWEKRKIHMLTKDRAQLLTRIKNNKLKAKIR